MCHQLRPHAATSSSAQTERTMGRSGGALLSSPIFLALVFPAALPASPWAVLMLRYTRSSTLPAPAHPGLPSGRLGAHESEFLTQEYRQQWLQEYKKSEPLTGLKSPGWTGLSAEVERAAALGPLFSHWLHMMSFTYFLSFSQSIQQSVNLYLCVFLLSSCCFSPFLLASYLNILLCALELYLSSFIMQMPLKYSSHQASFLFYFT